MSCSEGKTAFEIGCAVFNDMLESPPVFSSAVSVPHCDGAGKGALDCVSAEVAEGFSGHAFEDSDPGGGENR